MQNSLEFPGGTDPGGLSPFIPCLFVVEILETIGKPRISGLIDPGVLLQLKVRAEGLGTVGHFMHDSLAELPGFPVPGRSPATCQATSPAEFRWGYHPSASGAFAAAAAATAQNFSFDKLVFSKEIMLSQKMASQFK